MDRLDELLAANDGVLLRAEHPELRSTFGRACGTQRLAVAFPGVYIDAAHRTDPDLLAMAALRRFPSAVLCLHSAARLTFWPSLVPPAVQLAGVRPRHQVAGFAFSGRAVPPEWIARKGRLRLTTPEFTAVDLAPATDGESIDHVLRMRMGTIDGLRAAHAATARSPGQRARARLLLDSRADPWSAAERLAHRILRAIGIDGWRGNYRIQRRGQVFYLDIAFLELKLVIEIDGREFHTSPKAFEDDRERQNLLVLEGWIVIRFTWKMLSTDPDYVMRTTIEAVELARATIDLRRRIGD